MKREVIMSVVAVSVLFVVIVMLSRSGSTQTQISDCKQPFGDPPCKANNDAKFNDGKNTGCTVEFTGCDAMELVTVKYTTHAQTLGAKMSVRVAAL